MAMKPILIPLALLNRMIMPAHGKGPTVSRAELEVLAEIGRKEGTLDAEEFRVLSNVMNLSEVRAGDVMTPRTRIIAIPSSSTLDEAIATMLDVGHMRLPVYGETLDDIVGILLARDLFSAAREALGPGCV
jgi:putative hemolysin